MTPLERLFLRKATVGSIAAHDLFVNRLTQQEVFEEAYERVHLGAQVDPSDLVHPRGNVIVFFGMGGIGKTSLSKRLESRLLDAHTPRRPAPFTFRVDFSDSSFLDPEALVLALRAALGSAGGIRTPAFDLGLAAYWRSKHPGEPLRVFVERSGWLAKVTKSSEAAGNLAESLEDLLSLSSLASLSFGLGKKLVVSLKRRHETLRLLQECPLLDEMLAAEDPDELRLFLPYLLAWDLHRLEADARLAVTVFADTFEDVQDASRGPRDIEDMFSRAVYLMPNSLFVVTGRNRLRWGSQGMAERLFFHGRDRWPGLVGQSDDDSRQQCLGPLTDDDAQTYIESRLTGIDVDARILKELVAHGQGWPLYLDLQGTRIERLVNRGGALDASEFGGPLVELVIRIMRDMEGWECDLLRASALTTNIDPLLLKAAIPEIRESQISQFLDSGFLRGGLQVRALNRALRESVIEADPELEDRWSSDYWVVVAQRVLAHHRGRLNANDPALLTSAFTDGFDLAARFGLQPSWLPVAAERLFARGSWEVLRLPAASPLVQKSSIRSLAVAAKAAALRATGDTSSAQALMEAMISQVESLEGAIRDYVAWQIVASAERAGAHAVAARFSDAMVTPVFRARGLIRMGRLAWIRGDLDHALGLADSASRESQAAMQRQDDAADFLKSVSVTHRSLVGWIRFTQGRFREATGSFTQGLDIARSWGDEFFVASELAHLAITAAFGNASDAPRYVELALRQAERVGAVRQLAQTRTAEAMVRAQGGDLDVALSRLSDIAVGLVDAGDDVEVRWPLFARVVLLARAGSMEEAREEAAKLRDLSHVLSAHACLAQIALWLSWTEDVTGKGTAVESWGDDWEAVRRRWLDVGTEPSAGAASG